jgi:hypothetical protein
MSLNTLYLIVDGVLLLISCFVLWRLLRLRRWDPARGQPQERIRWIRKVGLPLLVDWGLPLAFVAVVWPWLSDGLGTDWITLVRAVPDVGWWLMGAGAVLVLAGAVRVWLVLRAQRSTADERRVRTSPSAG